jgi:hypothetical protein
MRSLIRQFEKHVNAKPWPILTGPIVVFAHGKNVMKSTEKIAAGHGSAHSRDGPIIFHMRDGPPNVTGPPGGTGPPRFSSESGPPKTTDQPMEWLVKRKSLKKT